MAELYMRGATLKVGDTEIQVSDWGYDANESHAATDIFPTGNWSATVDFTPAEGWWALVAQLQCDLLTHNILPAPRG